MKLFSCAMLVVAMLLSGVFDSHALAALPPLSPQQLAQNSDMILTGKVTKIRRREISDEPGFVDTDFYIDLIITKVTKGQFEPGKPITISTWQPKQRPEGWAGPQGQNLIPKTGNVVQVFGKGTTQFSFRRGGQREVAHVLLEPNGLEIIADVVPGQYIGRWEYVRKRDPETHTTTLRIFPDGTYTEAHKVMTDQTGKSSIARGTAASGNDRLVLDGTRTLMRLRDGRLLLEGGYEIMVFTNVPDAELDAARKSKSGTSTNSKAQEFAAHIGVTIQELPGNELKVLTVRPGSSAARKGIGTGDVLYSWTFDKSPSGSAWTAKIRPAR